jgi:hypothetical protein
MYIFISRAPVALDFFKLFTALALCKARMHAWESGKVLITLMGKLRCEQEKMNFLRALAPLFNIIS